MKKSTGTNNRNDLLKHGLAMLTVFLCAFSWNTFASAAGLDFSIEWETAPPEFVSVDEPFSLAIKLDKFEVGSPFDPEAVATLNWRVKNVKFKYLAGPKKTCVYPKSQVCLPGKIRTIEESAEFNFKHGFESAGKYKCIVTVEAAAVAKCVGNDNRYYKIRTTQSIETIINVEPYKVSSCFADPENGEVVKSIIESGPPMHLVMIRNADFNDLTMVIVCYDDEDEYHRRTGQWLATPGNDYLLYDTDVLFKQGEKQWKTTLEMINDAFFEPDETIVLDFSGDPSRFVYLNQKRFDERIVFEEKADTVGLEKTLSPKQTHCRKKCMLHIIRRLFQ